MGKQKHEPRRTCVACRQPAGKRALIRVVRSPDGAVTLDATGRAHGRGAYLHDDVACIETARKRQAVERSLKAQVPAALWDQLKALRARPDNGDPAFGALRLVDSDIRS